MALPDFSMRQLLEAGVHFGTNRTAESKMADFISVPATTSNHRSRPDRAVLHTALKAVSDTVAKAPYPCRRHQAQAQDGVARRPSGRRSTSSIRAGSAAR